MFEDLMFIDIEQQTMEVKCADGFSKEYIVSTAAKGEGNIAGSYQTPLGKHSVCEKYGEAEPLLTIFKSRQKIGVLEQAQLNQPIEEDMILTRILRLHGEEPGINQGRDSSGNLVDSYDRYIYIHGTNREDLLGTPSSHGCIRMSNQAIVELFPHVPVGAKVIIAAKNRFS